MLTWSSCLKGTDLLVVTDSSATMGNLLKGSSSDAHSQELVAFWWFIVSAFEISV